MNAHKIINSDEISFFHNDPSLYNESCYKEDPSSLFRTAILGAGLPHDNNLLVVPGAGNLINIEACYRLDGVMSLHVFEGEEQISFSICCTRSAIAAWEIAVKSYEEIVLLSADTVIGGIPKEKPLREPWVGTTLFNPANERPWLGGFIESVSSAFFIHMFKYVAGVPLSA